MRNLSEIVKRGCNPLIAAAIEQVVSKWKGYSTDPNAKRSVVHLIEKYIDPAVATYMRTIPKTYHYSIAGGNRHQYSKLIKINGYNEARRILEMYQEDFSISIDYNEDKYQ